MRRFLFGREKLRLAFEYGVIISRVAREHGIELTPELIEKAEAMIIGESENQSPTHLSVNMFPNILSVFELDLSK
jgi:NOL1/NOP2/fmu family ribosome biogenesis protein